MWDMFTSLLFCCCNFFVVHMNWHLKSRGVNSEYIMVNICWNKQLLITWQDQDKLGHSLLLRNCHSGKGITLALLPPFASAGQPQALQAFFRVFPLSKMAVIETHCISCIQFQNYWSIGKDLLVLHCDHNTSCINCFVKFFENYVETHLHNKTF